MRIVQKISDKSEVRNVQKISDKEDDNLIASALPHDEHGGGSAA
jgi:hypothetical protein